VSSEKQKGEDHIQYRQPSTKLVSQGESACAPLERVAQHDARPLQRPLLSHMRRGAARHVDQITYAGVSLSARGPKANILTFRDMLNEFTVGIDAVSSGPPRHTSRQEAVQVQASSCSCPKKRLFLRTRRVIHHRYQLPPNDLLESKHYTS